MAPTGLSGSFRDPAGRLFVADGIVYRRIDAPGREAYDRLMQSGLYDALIRDGLLVAHDDLGPSADHPGAHTVIRPEQVPMVSYPYEWCFSQLQDAALVTLRAQRRALELGMSLKDASAYNVQFLRGRPILVDTLSFEPHRPRPWFAYRQFCQHFYAPLLLASAVDARLTRLSQLFIDGVPIGLASRLLPYRSLARAGPLLHIHLHAVGERRWSSGNTPGKPQEGRASTPRAALALVDSLERAVERLRWTPKSDWSSYYGEQASYESDAFAHKADILERWLERVHPRRVWDIGANTGHFSKLAARQGASVVAFDRDPACVETLYREVRGSGSGTRVDSDILPLVCDLANPSPSIGWASEERMTIEARGPADLVLALALVHHVAIGNNVPLPSFAAYLARLGRRAIVEFVPKSDRMVQRMLASRDDVFDRYTSGEFERAIEERFTIEDRAELTPSSRTAYLLAAR